MHREIKKVVLKEWVGITIAWILALYFYYILITWSYGDELAEGPLKDYLGSLDAHLEIVLSGLFFGFLFSLINTQVDHTKLNRKSLGYIILVKSLLYALALGFTGLIVLSIFRLLGLPKDTSFDELTSYLTTRSIAALGAYILFIILLINFIKQINRKIGPGIFSAMILGKYHKPKDEDRIFLFIDLKGSTNLTEKLGHKIYSQFLKDCFFELNQLIIPYQAQIYQYVGDEAVLTWPVEKGLTNLKCLDLFFEFVRHLKRKTKYFEETYGAIPSFKAGMDAGEVTVSEIGEIKREIAYHGDVLNTTARIEALCNEYNARLITTERVVSRVNSESKYFFEPIGQVSLKGKKEKLMLYKVGPEA